VEKRTKIAKFRLQYIGKISYELYLVHYSVFILLVNIAPKMNPLIELVVVLIMTVLMIAGFHSFMHLKRKAENLLIKDKFLDAKRQAGNIQIIAKGGTINEYD